MTAAVGKADRKCIWRRRTCGHVPAPLRLREVLTEGAARVNQLLGFIVARDVADLVGPDADVVEQAFHPGADVVLLSLGGGLHGAADGGGLAGLVVQQVGVVVHLQA